MPWASNLPPSLLAMNSLLFSIAAVDFENADSQKSRRELYFTSRDTVRIVKPYSE